MKEMAAAMNLSETTLKTYLTKNRNLPAQTKAKEAAMAMGWVPSYRNRVSTEDLLRHVQEVIPTLKKMDVPVTGKMVADKLRIATQTFWRAYKNTDPRKKELEQAVRTAAQIMGFIPGRRKPHTVKPVTFWWGGNYHSHTDELARMKQLRDEGFTNAEIARKIGRAYTTVLNNIGKQPAMMTDRSHSLAGTFRKQTAAARAAYAG